MRATRLIVPALLILTMAAEVNFANQIKGEGVDEIMRFKVQVAGRDKDVVHIQQQAAAGSPRGLADKIRLCESAFFECQIA